MARVSLSAWCVVAVMLDPVEYDPARRLAPVLLFGYAVSSLLFLILLLRARGETAPATPLLAHAADALWATTACALTGGLRSPFFILFVFALLSAAYRWGSRETMITAGAAVALLASQILLAPTMGLAEALPLRTLLIRSGSLLVLAHLLGYLADEEKKWHAEAAILARIMERVQGQTGLRPTLQALLDEVLRLLGANRALLAVNDAESGRSQLWDAARGDAREAAQLRLEELDAQGRSRYFFPTPADAWVAERRGGTGGLGLTLLALDERDTLRIAPGTLPAGSPAELARDRLLAASASVGSQWSGRLFVIDPGRGPARGPELRLLLALARRAAPAVRGAYLVDRLHIRAGAAERARVARELHDGVIQSLIGLEMQVDVLRQRAVEKSSHTAGALTHIQALLRAEVLTVRELMDQMRAVEVGATELLDRLAVMVDRFGRETGLSARFVSEVEDVSLDPALCREITRIVQEALVNVRRHSGASHVLVRFGRQDGQWAVSIDDNGNGFGFSGRLDLAALDAERKGPVVIKERVRAAGGRLTIESQPGRGARLEILISPERHG
jgi:signal transduction histidine kinase